MPVACVTLEETNRTIMAASYFKIIQDVLGQVNIPYGTLVAMHKGLEVNRTDNVSNLTSEQRVNLPSTVGQRRVIVNITEEYNEDALTTSAVDRHDTSPIFKDREIDLTIYPVYISTDVTFDIKFITPSKTEANRLRDELRIKLSQMRNIGHHSVEYDILIPEAVSEIIADVHNLKNRLHPSELGEYFRAFSTKQAHLITDTANAGNACLAIRERQVRIVGRFDFNPMPEVVEDDHDQNTYKVSIPYKFTLEIARGMCMNYPVTVCNRPMPSKYLKWIQEAKVRTNEEYSRNLTYTSSLGALSHFESHRQLDYRINNKLPLNLPLWDSFPERQGHPGCMITATFLTSVNEKDRRTLFNLRDIPDFHMNERFLQHLASGERKFVTKPYESLFYFGLHYPDRYFHADRLEIDQDLTIRSTVDLPLEKTTRVSFSICLDPTFLTKYNQQRWFRDKELALLYLWEMVLGFRDYKHELRPLLDYETAIFNSIADIFQVGVDTKDKEFLNEVIVALSDDPLLLERIVNLLRSKRPGIYTLINRLIDLDKYKFHKVKYANGNDNSSGLIPKTVLTASVTAVRK